MSPRDTPSLKPLEGGEPDEPTPGSLGTLTVPGWVQRWSGDSPTWQVAALGLPISLALAGQVVMAFVNNLMMATLGTAAVAAVSLPGVMALMVITLLAGVAASNSHLAARRLGAGDAPGAGSMLWQGLYVAALTVPVSVVMALMAPAIFAALNPHDHELARLQTHYFVLRVLACPTAVGSLAVAGFLQGVGQPYRLAVPMLCCNVLNLVANYALIFGHWGLPALGLTGAALATVLGSVVQFVWLLGATVAGSPGRLFGLRRPVPPHGGDLATLARWGLPTTLEKTLEFAGWGAFLALLAVMAGRVQLAAGTIVLQWMALAFMPMVGLATAVAALSAQALGRQRPQQVPVIVAAGRWLALPLAGLAAVVFLWGGPHLAGVFSDDPAVVAATSTALAVVAIAPLAQAFLLITAAALRGAGQTLAVAAIMAVGQVGVLMPVTVAVLTLGWGAPAAWAAMGLATAVMAGLCHARLTGQTSRWASL